MADRRLQELADCMQRMTLIGKQQEDDMFDYKAGLITLNELQHRQITTQCERESIMHGEILPLERQGYHCNNLVIKLPNGEMKKIGLVFYADGIPQFVD
jgi:hypothetical protein